MFLHQEYLKRQNIDIDWTAFPSSGSLVFRSAEPKRNRWVLVNFDKEGPDYHPQTYRIHTIVPLRNHGGGGNGIGGYSKRHKITWESLDDWISKFIVKAHKLRIIKDPLEKKLTLWEAFVFCNDNMLATCKTQDRRILFKTLDPSLSFEERSKNLDQLIRDYNSSDYNIGYAFESNLSQYNNDQWINRGQ